MTLIHLLYTARRYAGTLISRSSSYHAPKGDIAERLTSGLTVFLYSLGCLFCVTHFFWGRGQISCWFEHQDINENWIRFINDFCYVEGTYFVPLANPQPWRAPEQQPVYYYQWVPYVLAIQAVLLYLPEQIWLKLCCTRICAVDLCDLCQTLKSWWRKCNTDPYHLPSTAAMMGLPRQDNSSEKGAMFARKAATYFLAHLQLSRARTFTVHALPICYLFTKLLYCLISLGVLFWLNINFGNSDRTRFWGVATLMNLIQGIDWEITGVFPRVTYCQHARHRYGSPPLSVVRCTLPMMAYYEKIFLFFWFWLSFVTLVNMCLLLYWFIALIMPSSNYCFVQVHLMEPTVREHMDISQDDEYDILLDSFISDYLDADGVFLLRKVASDCGSLATAHLISALYADFVTCVRARQEHQERGGSPLHAASSTELHPLLATPRSAGRLKRRKRLFARQNINSITSSPRAPKATQEPDFTDVIDV